MAQSPEVEQAGILKDDQSVYLRNRRDLNRRMRNGESFSGREQNCAFLNMADGRFATVSAAAGLGFADDARTHVLVDWDHDGDVDIWSANRTAPQLRFMKNTLPKHHGFVAIRLRGQECNRDGIGALVTIKLADDDRPIIRQVQAGSGFLGQSSKTLTIGLGRDAVIESVSVRWPGSISSESFSGVGVNQRHLLVQGTGLAQSLAPRSATKLSPGELVSASSSVKADLLLSSKYVVPAIPYQTFDGQDGSLLVSQDTSSTKNATLVSLWATWCTPCIKELHELKANQAALAKHGIGVLALSMDDIDNQAATGKDAAGVIANLQPEFPTGLATTQTLTCLQTLYDLPFQQHHDVAIPASFLIGEDQRLLAIYRGAVNTQRVISDLERSQLDYKELVTATLPFDGRWHRLPNAPSLLVIPVQLMEHGEVDLVWDMIQRNPDLYESENEFGKLLVWIGDERFKNGAASEALAIYEEALRVNPTNMLVTNNIAWQFAANSDLAVRDGAKAVHWATVAAQATNYRNVAVLDTLAAAYAQDKQFDKAVEVVQRAIGMAQQQGDTAKAAKYRQRLALYEQKQALP